MVGFHFFTPLVSCHCSLCTICSADFVDVVFLRHFGGVASLGGGVHQRVSLTPTEPSDLLDLLLLLGRPPDF